MRGWLKKLLAIVYSDVIANLSIPFHRKKAAKKTAGKMTREISPVSSLSTVGTRKTIVAKISIYSGYKAHQ